MKLSFKSFSSVIVVLQGRSEKPSLSLVRASDLHALLPNR